MPSVTKLIRLATLPETRRAVVVAARSDALRDVTHRARSDRSGLVRDLARPRQAVGLVRSALLHPATRELANVGYVLLPGRYLAVGWAATRLSRRVLGRSGDKPRTKVRASGG
jgi:hypothetical protein